VTASTRRWASWASRVSSELCGRASTIRSVGHEARAIPLLVMASAIRARTSRSRWVNASRASRSPPTMPRGVGRAPRFRLPRGGPPRGSRRRRGRRCRRNGVRPSRRGQLLADAHYPSSIAGPAGGVLAFAQTTSELTSSPSVANLVEPSEGAASVHSSPKESVTISSASSRYARRSRRPGW
jgi:hypothetical protein